MTLTDRLTTMLVRPRGDLHSQYQPSIALWQDAHNCVVGDFTGEQLARCALLRQFGGDTTWAARVWFQRLLIYWGRVGLDDDYPDPDASGAVSRGTGGQDDE